MALVELLRNINPTGWSGGRWLDLGSALATGALPAAFKDGGLGKFGQLQSGNGGESKSQGDGFKTFDGRGFNNGLE
jgi:hypothetical protein